MKRPNRDHPIFEFSLRFPLVRQPVHLVNFIDNRCCISCLVSLLMLFYFTIFILLNFFHIIGSKRKRTNHHVKCPFVNKLKSPYLKKGLLDFGDYSHSIVATFLSFQNQFAFWPCSTAPTSHSANKLILKCFVAR